MFYNSYWLSLLFFIFYFLLVLCVISNVLCLILQVCDSFSALPNLLLKFSFEFFNSVIVFFNARIYVLFALVFYDYISLSGFTFCSCIVLLILFSYVSVFL